jgi:penicillin-binding protein 2
MSLDFISNPEEAKEYLPRYRFFYIAIAVTFAVFTMRLWYLQVMKGSEMRVSSENNRLKQIKIKPPRGLILDSQGRIMVENHPGFEATLSPQYIKDLEGTAKKVAPIVGMNPETIITKVKRIRRKEGPFAVVRLKDKLSRDEVFRLKRIRLETPGLDIDEVVVRHYPMDYNGASLFGYVSQISKKQIPAYNKKYEGLMTFEQGDIIGMTGLEEIFEKEVRGENGAQFIQVDAFGRAIMTENKGILGEELTKIEPTPGMNVVLTIDKDLQDAAWNSFQTHGRVGGLVAMKANGEILAWTSSPAVNPNDFPRGISDELYLKYLSDPNKPFRNKVIQDHYNPGSTFKPFVALAALEEKIISDKTIIYAPGMFMFGRRPYHDSHKEGHGNISVYEALERSSNVFFFKMGIQLGIDKMYNYIAPFGIGVRTGIELPREVSGRMPNSEWKKKSIGEEWQPGENLSAAIGQGFVETQVLQLAVAYNAIGLEGKVVQPFVVKKIIDNNNQVIREVEPKILRDLTEIQPTGVRIKTENFKVVKEGLRRVVMGSRGTAQRVRIPGIEIAGKTGTSQVMGFSADQIHVKCMTRVVNQRHHGWFVGYAPADNPMITVAAIAEHSCSGAGGAGPLVRDVLLAYFQKYHPEMIKESVKVQKAKVAAPLTLPEVPEGE